MMTTQPHPLVTSYLGRLRSESLRLPEDQAHELLVDIDAHLAEALPQGAGEAQVRQVLDRLGEPAELVDAAGAAPRRDPALQDQARGSGREALAGMLLLGAAVLFPFWFFSVPMWVAGLVLVALSPRWSQREKILAALSWGTLLPVAWVTVGLLGLVAWSSTECLDEVCTTTTTGPTAPAHLGWVVAVAGLAYLLFVAWATVRLIRSARR